MRFPKPSRAVRRWLEVAFWAVVVGVIAWRAWPQASAAIGIARGDRPVPDVAFTTLEGERITMAELRGQVVLVNFWATWCGPCRVEMPGFQDVYESRRERGFTIIGVSQDVGTPDLVREFVRQYDITYPIVGGTAAIERAFGGVSALPTSFLVGRDGRVRHVVTGIFLEPALRAAVDRLLEEPHRPKPIAQSPTPKAQRPTPRRNNQLDDRYHRPPPGEPFEPVNSPSR